VRSTTVRSGLAARARVVLLASQGLANYEIAALASMIHVGFDLACPAGC
jgi:hypothetical protein